MTVDTPATQTFADELRVLADYLDEHPSAYPAYPQIVLNLFFDDAPSMAAARRGIGGSWEKEHTEGYVTLRQRVTPRTHIDLNVQRDRACERVQVGTTVETMPDPELIAEIPKIEVEVPVWEWQCSPILEPSA